MSRFLLLILLLAALPVEAQPVPGVVWQADGDVSLQLQELGMMAGLGFRAIRMTDRIDPEVAERADSLGMTLWIDLETAYLPDEALADSLRGLSQRIAEIDSMAERFASVRYLGLSVVPDLTDPEVCQALREARAFLGAETKLRTYVLLWNLSAGACREVVDLVLASTADLTLPDFTWSDGIGAWGYPVVQGRRGLQQEQSPERQALGLETDWALLQGQEHVQVAFWYQWRNAGDTSIDPTPFRTGFALHPPSESNVLTRRTAQALLPGGQSAFSYAGGVPKKDTTPPERIIGWILILSIVGLLILSHRFRMLVPRYFGSHVFYRQAVEEARDLVAIPTSVLLAVYGIIVGMLTLFVVEATTQSGATRILFAWSSPPMRSLAESLYGAPIMLVLLAGSVAVVGLLIWSSVWIAVSGSRLRPLQTLTMVVWARWQVLPLLVAVMVLADVPAQQRVFATVAVVGVWLLSALWGSLRASRDLTKIARLPAAAIWPMWLLSPAWLVLHSLILIALLYADRVTYVMSATLGG